MKLLVRVLLTLPFVLAGLRPALAQAEGAFTVLDDDVAPMAREYARYGGPAVLGPPISRRFVWDGFVVQAFQKGVLQWRPELGYAVPVNVLDELAKRGKDDYLAGLGVPRHDPPKSEAEALARLDAVPELKAYILAAPDWKVRFGLPISVGLRPDFQVVRLQRAVLQRWLWQTPWANPGDITLANVGDMLKGAGLIPAEALQPQPAGSEPEWLKRLNSYRARLGFPPVEEDPVLSAGAARHARYIVATQTFEHREDPQSPFYSPEGDRAARNGNIWRTTDPNGTAAGAVDGWVASPGHASLALNPGLRRVGFGDYRDPNAPGTWKYAATLELTWDTGPVDPGLLPAVWPMPAWGSRWRFTWNPNPCPEPARPGVWALVYARWGDPVAAVLSRDGQAVPTTIFPLDHVAPNVGSWLAAACEAQVVPGNYHVEVRAGEKVTSRDFTVLPW